MSSEIDPMVQELIDATRNAAQAGGADNDEWRDETAERLTARLAQPTVTREQIREAIRSFPYLLIPPITYGYDVDRFLDNFANHVIAVIALDTEGGE